MSSLADIQGDFQKFILGDDAELEARVIGTARVPVATRLGIYANAYTSRLVEALQANFPVLAEVLGPADFAALGATYVRAHPSRFASIRYYGDALADFLAAHPDYESVPLLAELARWEWTLADVFDAPDRPSIDAAALQRVPPEEWEALRFEWHPSARHIALSWNAPQIWKAVSEKGARPAIEVQAEPVTWLLWRRELRIRYRDLPAEEAVAMRAVSAGESFGALCEQLCASGDEASAPLRAASMLGEWVQSGLIAGLR